MEYHGLHEVAHIAPCNRHVKVRVSRKWEEFNTNTGELMGLNLILINQYHKRIHAWIDSHMMAKYEGILIEGEVYKLDYFEVQPFIFANRCFHENHHIKFSKDSVLRKVDDAYTIIPQKNFMFSNLKNIQPLGKEDSALIDVVGIIKSLKDEQRVTNNTKQSKTFVDFQLTDLINKVDVRLWDDLGKSFKKAFDEATDLPPIIIIASAKLRRNEYTGYTTLTNLPPTIFYVNANNERVDTLRKRYWEVNGI